MINCLGIIGGVGPLAAVHFYQRLLQLSGATQDEHYPAVVVVADRVPSRVSHLLGAGPSPAPVLVRAAHRLEEAGADAIVIPSATTHAYLDDIASAVRVPVVNLLAETGAVLRERGARHPLMLATAATVQLRLFEPYLDEDTMPVYPCGSDQRFVSAFIDRVKAGEDPHDYRAEFARRVNELVRRTGADSVILGCTELPLINPGMAINVPIIDTTDVLAHAILSHRAHPITRKAPEGRAKMASDVGEQWTVVINDEEQYSIWSAKRPVPQGWHAIDMVGSKEACLDHIDEIWTDMRPKSLREKMNGSSALQGVVA